MVLLRNFMKRKRKVSRHSINEFPHDGGAKKGKVINKGRALEKLTYKKENFINYTTNVWWAEERRGNSEKISNRKGSM